MTSEELRARRLGLVPRKRKHWTSATEYVATLTPEQRGSLLDALLLYVL